ncbi:hypothetical protein [Epiphyas postvittana nucleopolyhedrovirus]|uniref:Uncharacterized protein n=1 Tax=Epiphyas postvittana nucleopolyhedrovirus TaxID=70600 RepID=Q91GI7_NPVEP|nr:hypothetical protein [Epiphyas postvittana nucleopolyhedrovirus]AAK85630.1 unknown [Epiphyas postvittana nucleopolyhedrovirus]
MTSSTNDVPIVFETPETRPDHKTLRACAKEYTVDGLKLKTTYIEYYKQLQALVDFAVMTLSKQLNMKEYDEVYSLGRQLYELLRGVFVDEPFKLWLEDNAQQLANDEQFRVEIYKVLESQLQAIVKTNNITLKNAVLDVFNSKLNGEIAHYDTSHGYIKPNCIVLTFNCCNLTFDPPQ